MCNRKLRAYAFCFHLTPKQAIIQQEMLAIRPAVNHEENQYIHIFNHGAPYIKRLSYLSQALHTSTREIGTHMCTVCFEQSHTATHGLMFVILNNVRLVLEIVMQIK